MKLGNLDIKDIYVGSTPAAQMYLGSMKVWPEEQPAGDYWGLCFTAEDPGVSVSLHANSASAPQVNLLYSRDAVNWQTFTSDSTTVVLDNAGDKVWLKAGPGGNAGMGSSTSNSHSFRIENGRAAASGSIMSLLSGEAETFEIPAGQEGCFAQLFAAAGIPNTTCLLTHSPDLPATTLGRNCYRSMFANCTSLTEAPALPATTLADSCYYFMFQNCTSLSSAPALQATTLVNRCYGNMFQGCSSLTSISADFTEWSPSNATTNWVTDVSSSGTFYCPRALSDVYDASHIPVGWTREPSLNVNAVKFDNIGSTTGVIRITGTELELSDIADWEYSSDGSNWTQWDKTTKSLSVDAGDSLYIRAGEIGQSRLATNDSFNKANKILPMSSLFKVSGQLSSLLSKNGTIPAGPTQYQFASLFLQGLALVDASELEMPSTAAQYGYARTFGITGLSAAPVLQATTLAHNCYYFMFGQCTSLSTPPALPISTLYEGCYQYMFYGCTALTTVPALPATVMSMYCYQHMFEGCSGLSTVPEYLLWSVTQRSTGCYDSMFKDCTSLTSTPRLTANYLTNGCYSSMFANDIALISAKFPSAWDSELTSMFADDYSGGKTMFEDCDASQVWVTYVNGADWLSSLLPKPPAAVEGIKFTHVDVNYANITLSAVGDPENNGGHCDLVYSTDGENWSSYTVGTTITIYTDDYVIFKAANSYNSGIKSVDDSNYYQFVVEGEPKVEGDISYLYSNDPANDYLNSYQFAHLFEMCDFNTGSGYESEITLPSRGKWMASSASYAFKEMFKGTRLSRIKIQVDPDGWDSGAQFDGNFTDWVYDISQGYDQSPTFWIPQGWTWSYGYSAIPQDWSVQYSE